MDSDRIGRVGVLVSVQEITADATGVIISEPLNTALAGNPGQYPNASYFYAHASALNDVTSGNNSGSEDCGGDYQCNAVAGYDGPTGLGTPKGIGAF